MNKIKKLLTDSLLLLSIGSIISIVIISLILINAIDPQFGIKVDYSLLSTEKFNNLYLSLSTGYLTGYIIYIITIEIPKYLKKRRLYIYLEFNFRIINELCTGVTKNMFKTDDGIKSENMFYYLLSQKNEIELQKHFCESYGNKRDIIFVISILNHIRIVLENILNNFESVLNLDLVEKINFLKEDFNTLSIYEQKKVFAQQDKNEKEINKIIEEETLQAYNMYMIIRSIISSIKLIYSKNKELDKFF